MNVEKDLEIFLITYNRKEKLQNTLKKIYSDDSPIRNFKITILDNKSTDGSSELINSFISNYPNSKHIIHNRNIGGNANIARCYELAMYKYFWILCDDDDINWTNWQAVEQEIEADKDIIVVSNYLNPKENLAQLIGQLSFVPAGIYKTSMLNDTIMQNIEFQISTMFPQLSLVCAGINKNANIAILDTPIVKMVYNTNSSYTRGMSQTEKHPLMANMCWPIGFLKSIQMINDKEKIKFIIENLKLENGEQVLYPDSFIDVNKKICNSSFFNEAEYFALLPEKQKLMFVYDYYKQKSLKNTDFSFYENSELKYQKIVNSTTYKLGSLLLYLPKKLLRR